MNEKLLNFMVNYASPFFVGSLVTNQVLFVNKIAEKTFGCTKENCDFTKLFEKSEDSIKDLISNLIYPDRPSVIYNVTAISATGEKMFVDLHFGFFDETKNEIFLEITARGDSNLQSATNFINHSTKAEALLEFDEEFTICHSNQHFKDLFEVEEEFFIAKKYKKEIYKELEKSSRYTIEVEITLLNNKTKWIQLDLQKRNINSVGDKILCVATNIDEKIAKDEKLNQLNQYLNAMQEISDDVLFRIDVETMTLHRLVIEETDDELGQVVPNYMEILSNQNIIHPDDAGKYEQYAKDWFEGKIDSCSLRFMVAPDCYEWFEVQAKKIFDEKGNLKEVFGKLVNVQEREQLKFDLDELNDYFDIMQELTTDIVYKVDAKTMTLNHNIKSKHMLEKVGNNFPNYVDVFIEKEILHPDDVGKWAEFVEKRHNGIIEDTPFRFALMSEEYEWYLVKDKRIYDKNGELKELWGTLINVTREQELQDEYKELNQYYDVIQRLAENIVYKVDVDTMTLHHNIRTEQGEKIGNDIPNYLEVLINNKIIHPDDVGKYIKFVQDRHEGIVDDDAFRFALNTEKYEWFKLKDERIYDKTGKLIEVWGTMINVTREKELELKASHDLMTNVLNKVSFENQVAEILENSLETESHALIFIDLDDFKGVNDTLGHSFGDFLLTTVGKRLKRVVRENDIVGRVGGDEFVVFLRDIEENSALERTEVLLENLRREFVLDGKSRNIKASLGISIYPNHGRNYKDLIHKSDIALYASKGKGKNVATIFNEQIADNY